MIDLITMMYIKRVLRMHHSALIVIPPPICRRIGIKIGDYVQIETESGDGAARIRKIESLEDRDEPDSRYSDQTN